MRRFWVLFLADIRFQFRYGFYALYAFLSVLYTVLIRILPGSVRSILRELMVFSDPAALGLFFMGAILLFEKGERVHPSLSVSPAHPLEYCTAKTASLSLVSLLAGLLIIVASGGSLSLWTIAALLLSSAFFSLVGLYIGSFAKTLNGYLMFTVPAELLLFVPALLWYFDVLGDWMLLHPGAAALNLLRSQPRFAVLSLLSLLVWLALAAIFVLPPLTRMLKGNDAERQTQRDEAAAGLAAQGAPADREAL